MLEQKPGLRAASVQRAGNGGRVKPCDCASVQHKAAICNFILTRTQPYPPPRSCILVHKKSLCCPYLSCSKYHINYYKNSERIREQVNRLQASHDEKTLEKSSRTDDGEEETNGGKKNERMKEESTGNINKNIKTRFQVALKVEVCTHQVNYRALRNRIFLFNRLVLPFPVSFTTFTGSAMVKSSASLCSFCYCLNGSLRFPPQFSLINFFFAVNRQAEVHQAKVFATRHKVQSEFHINLLMRFIN